MPSTGTGRPPLTSCQDTSRSRHACFLLWWKLSRATAFVEGRGTKGAGHAEPCGARTWSSESDRLCAGSVDTTSVLCPAAANLTASDAARLVLPTPPLPLTITYLRAVPADSSSNAVAVGASSVAAAPAACAGRNSWGLACGTGRSRTLVKAGRPTCCFNGTEVLCDKLAHSCASCGGPPLECRRTCQHGHFDKVVAKR